MANCFLIKSFTKELHRDYSGAEPFTDGAEPIYVNLNGVILIGDVGGIECEFAGKLWRLKALMTQIAVLVAITGLCQVGITEVSLREWGFKKEGG